jgi:hypothetical protein
MGASAESRRAGDRERRLLRAVDPELADELDRRDLEGARRRARNLRQRLGMPVPPKPLPRWMQWMEERTRLDPEKVAAMREKLRAKQEQRRKNRP